LTEALTYPGLTALARFLRLRVHPVELDAEGIDPDALEAACRRHRPRVLYCVPTLHNPTTRTLSRERRRAIAAVARAHGVAILEDDVHRWLAPSAPMPLASFAPERAYYVGALSKAVTGALRVAFLAAPPENRERLTHSLWATHWTVAPLTAEIVCAWIEDGTAERTAARKRAEASRRQRLAREALRGLQIEGASTAYHIWLSLPEPWTSETFAAEAARQGLAVTPAEAFAVAPKRVPRAVRISLSGTDDREALRGSLARLAAMLRTPSGAVGTL
jgi:DNA-binding transcriptional MocR family regulator